MDGLRTDRLVLRRWRETDRAVFHRLNSDPQVMRFFPFRMSRGEADATMDLWNDGLDANAMSFLAVRSRESGEIVGVAGLAPVSEPIYGFAPTVQVGWRLLPSAWGRGLATEAASACLAYGFETLRLPEIVSQCVVENRASERVILRLGLRFRAHFDHPKISAQTHPHLLRHSLYATTHEEWRSR